ncbi:hypothetical protein M9H77_31715 [Catharanthus roseus]|uniref:Uncharacterized protein n=1 Tax=Catharanthus roseus TaxID=4058 RepID=A0ACC0A371_CATRO|nr:hypothetical protein M9H77_31715 [Catharanthus roseus]
MGSLKAMESIPSCLQSTQLIRSNQGTNLDQILDKSWRKYTLLLTTGSLLPSLLPTTDGGVRLTVAGRPREGNFVLFIGSWSFKSSIEVPQIKEEILGDIWIQFFKYNMIHITLSVIMDCFK